jgi:hypothetical protein
MMRTTPSLTSSQMTGSTASSSVVTLRAFVVFVSSPSSGGYLLVPLLCSYASGCEATGCTVWDAFQRMTQPLAAVKPWAVNLGNHETYDTANGIVAISARYRYHGMPFPPGSPDDIWYFSYEVRKKVTHSSPLFRLHRYYNCLPACRSAPRTSFPFLPFTLEASAPLPH